MEANPRPLNMNQAIEELRKAGYADEQIEKIRSFHEADRTVLIFENKDLGHPALGHIFAMPWDDEEIPPHGPDTDATGLGWRYVTTYIVHPNPSIVQEV